MLKNLISVFICIVLTKTTAAQDDDALSYYTVRGSYFLAVVFVRSIVLRDVTICEIVTL